MASDEEALTPRSRSHASSFQSDPPPRDPPSDLLAPDMVPLDHQRSPRRGSRKGKERAIVGEQRPGDGQQEHGYTYQEPEYLTVDSAHQTRVHGAQGSVSPSGMDPYYPSYQGPPSRGTYDTRDLDDPELGHMDRGGGGVGNRYGLGVTELGGATAAVGGAYPPVSEEEAEERRIQEHLAKIAARDMARRKAARTSKLYAPAATSHPSNGGMGATAGTALAPVTSTLVSGLSRASTLLRNRTRRGPPSGGSSGGGGGGSDADHLVSSSPHGKRPASMFGFWRIPSIDSSMAEEREEERRHGGWVGGEGNEHVGLQYKPPRSPTSFSPLPTISRPTSANPYEQPAVGSGVTAHAHTGYRVPSSSSASSLTDTLNPASAVAGGRNSPASRMTQPHIESDPVPLIRSDPPRLPTLEPAASWPNVNDPSAVDHHRRSVIASDSQQQQPPPPHHSRMTSGGSTAGWKGAHWRGGAGGGAAGYSAANPGASVMADGTELPVKRDRWWHALCAWGNELDDGAEDGQAGRTNPFE